MLASQRLKNAVNKIMAHYNGYQLPSNVREMYAELNAIGVEIGLITDRKDFQGGWQGKTNWYYHGNEIENSWFIYGVYEGNRMSRKNDYTIYVS